MNSLVGEFLDAHCPEGRKEQYIRCDELMGAFGVEEYEAPLMELVSVSEMYDKDEVLDRFHLRVDASVRELIADHGIKLTDDVMFETQLSIIKALELLQVWTDHAEILAILDMDGDYEERFARLVMTTTGLDENTVMWSIEEVNPDLFEQLEGLHTADAEEQQDPITGSDELVTSLVAVKKFIGDRSKYAMRILKSGYPLGAPIAFYANLMQRHWAVLPWEEAANELFVVLHMADNTYRNVITGYSEISSKLFDDLVAISNVDLRIKKLASEFAQYKLQQGN